MSDFRWEDPPPARPTSHQFDEIWKPVLDMLVDKPGKWAMIYETEPGKVPSAYNRATTMRKRYGALGRFEFVARTIDVQDGKVGRLYARHMPSGRPEHHE